MADFAEEARSEFNGSIPNLICLGTRLWSSASMHAYAYAGAHSDLRAFYVMTSLCAPTYKQQQTALDSGEIWEGADVDSIQIRHLRTDAASQIRRLRTDATFKDLLLRLNSLPQFRFVTSQLTLLQRFVALHAVRRQYLPSVDSKSSFDTKRHPISFGLAGTCRVTCIRLQCSLCLHVKQVTGSSEVSGINFCVCKLWTVIAELRRVWRMKTSFRHMRGP